MLRKWQRVHQLKQKIALIQKLSIQLASCKNTLKSIGYSSKIENPDSLKGVIDRLPYDTRKRWRHAADNTSEDKEREIRFGDIVSFVEREARTTAHPVFGNISNTSTSNDQDREKNRRQTNRSHGQTFATQAGDGDQGKGNTNSRDSSTSTTGTRDKNCFMCRKDHKLDDCPQFKAKSYEDRVQFAWNKFLCYNCLVPDHSIN